MNDSSQFANQLRHAFGPNPRVVVGVVDELLIACREHPLQLEWRAGTCHVHAPESIDVPLPKSVFRAILARLAALCNERAPNSVSPYGGSGELVIADETTSTFRVTFTNTPDEQRAEVQFIGEKTPHRLSPSV